MSDAEAIAEDLETARVCVRALSYEGQEVPEQDVIELFDWIHGVETQMGIIELLREGFMAAVIENGEPRFYATREGVEFAEISRGK